MNRIIKLTKNKIQKAGRNHKGRITVFHRGGGNKKLYRVIDYGRSLFDLPAMVKKIEYDPNRSCKIALISYKKGILSYILSPKNLKEGDIINSTASKNKVDVKEGNASPIGYMPLGTTIHNIELKPGNGGKLMRAAGTFAKVISFSTTSEDSSQGQSSTLYHNSNGTNDAVDSQKPQKKYRKNVIIRLHTGKLYSIPKECMATVGIVSNELHKNKKMRKAGENRWRGIRPTVRGVAMNPIDHPHGGGEGRSKGGRHPVTPWGKLTKGKPTSYLRKSTRGVRSKAFSSKKTKKKNKISFL